MASGSTPARFESANVAAYAAGAHIHCIFVTCFTHDFDFYRRLLPSSEIQLHRAETLEEIDFLLTVTGATVVISDAVFLDGTWEDALETVACVRPLAAFLVAASPADRQFVAAAPARGACGILWRPLDILRLTDAIRTANEAAQERAIWQASLRRVTAR